MTTNLADLLKIMREAESFVKSLVSATPEELMRALRPRHEDYARVFVPSAVDKAQLGYGELWNTPPRSLGKPNQTEVHAVGVATGASLVDENDLSKGFPGGYRKIAHLLQPDIVVVAFKLVAPGESLGMAYDGLVKLDDRWAWFPKPWRVLGEETTN
jgi:hypothetical protein